jgi:hypothetical protein
MLRHKRGGGGLMNRISQFKIIILECQELCTTWNRRMMLPWRNLVDLKGPWLMEGVELEAQAKVDSEIEAIK